MDNELKSKIEQAVRTAEDFTRLYYKYLDKQRNQLSRLYLENGLLVWNGNGISGKDNIQKYVEELPDSDHHLGILDAQPYVDNAVSGQPTLLIQSGGNVKYTNHPSKPFQQTFVITAQGDKWKIVSDCYRLQDCLQANQK
ncbi:NTF2-related export protein [Condylostylus longicornis]|uniref:NTF2-related export protein n=1 Tax=Condylostylus longicornis TaxID=2530218 RepID=UPI00244DB7BA|nr:NTF2-related export protein [Condylostylus longicornis]